MGTYSGFECDCCGRRFEYLGKGKYENNAQPVIIFYGVLFNTTKIDISTSYPIHQCWCRECVMSKSIWIPRNDEDKKIAGYKKSFVQIIRDIKLYFTVGRE